MYRMNRSAKRNFLDCESCFPRQAGRLASQSGKGGAAAERRPRGRFDAKVHK
jgi:hypothetical protein